MAGHNEWQSVERLLSQAASLEIRARQSEVLAGPDAAEFMVRIELEILREADESFPGDDSGALGLLFALACLSFEDARARGFSEQEFRPDDQFTLADFVGALTYTIGAELTLDTDYVRGRRMKTRLTARLDGTVLIETRGRGKAAEHWVARLQGERRLRAVPDT